MVENKSYLVVMESQAISLLANALSNTNINPYKRMFSFSSREDAVAFLKKIRSTAYDIGALIYEDESYSSSDIDHIVVGYDKYHAGSVFIVRTM